MKSIKAIFNGSDFKLLDPVPVDGMHEATITFGDPFAKKQDKILLYFNMWNNEDIDCIKEIIEKRMKFRMPKD